MRDALDTFIGDEEKLAAPNRAVRAVARAVPRHAERGQLDLVLGDARQDVGDVMLHLNDSRSAERRLGVLEFTL